MTHADRKMPRPGLGPTLLLLLALSAAGLLAAPHLILGAPTESTMGFVQRIFYFHVPCCSLAMLGALLCGVASGVYLFTDSPRADRVALAAGELTVVFGLCALVTGPLWARKAWGVWWQWDVRLTTTMLLWIIFISYLFARKYGGPSANRLGAGLALFGAADVPLIYVSVSIWRTIHPKTTVVSTLDPSMRPAFYVAMLSFHLLFVALLLTRIALERARARHQTLYLTALDAGLCEE